VKVILVDFHAEATSDKQLMGRFLDGRVSAVLGTHTHVPTTDQRIFPRGTAFVCDLGMCGVRDSIIGVEVAPVMRKFLTGMPARFKVPDKHGAVQFNSVLVDIDDTSRCARSIERVDREWTPEENE
jgi:calcineurin-like phosphoesterase